MLQEIIARITKQEITAKINKQSITAKLTGNLIMAKPQGTNKQIQFNDNGVFGGFGSYDKDSDELTLSILKLTGAITEESQAITLAHLNATPAGGILTTDIENWDTAFGWGDHAGLYDSLGEANSVLNAHEGEYNHELIATAQQISEKGQNNGYSGLDSGGKIPLTHLPSTLLVYKGVWNATTNTPTLTATDTTKKGFVYNVAVAGTQFGIAFSLGDWAIYNDDGVLEKSDNSDDVTSVNGQQGAVVLNADHISDSTTTNKFVTTAEKGIWNGKQDALGYTPENAVNKKTTLTDSDTDYPTTMAVNGALSAKVSWGGNSLASKGLIGTTSNQPFGIITNNTEKVTVLANGNVGIGTTAPGEKLEISGNIKLPSNNYIAALGSPTSGNGGYFQGTGESGSNAGYGAWMNYNAYWNGTNWIQPRGTLSTSMYSTNYHLGWTWRTAGASGTNGSIITPAEIAKLSTSGSLTLSGVLQASGTGSSYLMGNVGIGITTPTAKLDINSDILRLRTAKTPATAGASGNAGDICWDSSYFYICVATNTWKKAELLTW